MDRIIELIIYSAIGLMMASGMIGFIEYILPILVDMIMGALGWH